MNRGEMRANRVRNSGKKFNVSLEKSKLKGNQTSEQTRE